MAKFFIALFLSLAGIPLSAADQKHDFAADTPVHNFKLKLTSGDSLDFSKLPGRYVVFDFFFMACQPCHLASKELQSLRKKYHDSDLFIVGMDVRDTNVQELNAFIKRTKINYPVCIGARPIAKAYGAQGYPLILLFDQQRNLAWYTDAYYEDFSDDIVDIIDK